MMKPKVLMAVSVFYTCPLQVGSHHYARAFEKLGYDVGYISFPISPFHKLFGSSTEYAKKQNIYKNRGEIKENIWHYVPKALLTPHKYFPFSTKIVFDNWYKLSYPNILKILKKHTFEKVDILWFDSPVYHFLLDKIQAKKVILRLADYSRGFSNLSPFHYKKEIEIAKKADQIIYSAKNLKNKYHQITDKSKMIYIPNGIDLEYINSLDTSFPDEYKNIPGPRIVYLGAIHEWFDLELVYESAKALPDSSFIIIGPAKINLDKLKSLNNIFILGTKDYSKIGTFLKHADVGIIPFKSTPLVQSIHPLKLYEYLAFDLPVVSIEWEEIKELQEFSLLAKNKDEFIHGIKTALKKKKQKYPELENFSWQKKLQNILANTF